MMLSKKDRPYETVLIETLWNVKQDTCKKPSTGFSSFNRNIVECKELRKGADAIIGKGFNRNIVECKGVRDRRS